MRQMPAKDRFQGTQKMGGRQRDLRLAGGLGSLAWLHLHILLRIARLAANRKMRHIGQRNVQRSTVGIRRV